MNILFYTTFEVSPNKGGIERITTTLSSEFTKEYGWNCYSAYGRPIDDFYSRSTFKEKICIYVGKEYDRMLQFLKENQIDVIINQSDFNQSFHFRQIIQQAHLRCKLVFAHHFAPNFEIERFPLFSKYIRLQNWQPSMFLKSFYHVIKYHQKKLENYRYYKNGYRQTCLCCDKIVLLSAGYIDDFQKIADVKCLSKITVIHNTLTYPSYFDMANYDNKKKEVLIVARLEEYQKRISSALSIWRNIEQANISPEWTLCIVGTGENEKDYKKFVAHNGLKRIMFLGVKDALSEYQSASIFIMTSRSEGWGLTLMEAQQNACVPLAYNSYAAVSDVITDGIDGFIVKNADERDYLSKLKLLMKDKDLRRKMAKAALVKSHSFEKKVIISQWHKLLVGLINN